jgi:hypothetical protein
MLKWVVQSVALALLGVGVATVGVGAHRAYGFVGVALGLLLVVTASVFARAWARWLGYAVFASAWAAMTMVYAQRGPGNSVLIASDTNGYLWLYGGALVIVLVALVPRTLLEGRDVTA